MLVTNSLSNCNIVHNWTHQKHALPVRSCFLTWILLSGVGPSSAMSLVIVDRALAATLTLAYVGEKWEKKSRGKSGQRLKPRAETCPKWNKILGNVTTREVASYFCLYGRDFQFLCAWWLNLPIIQSYLCSTALCNLQCLKSFILRNFAISAASCNKSSKFWILFLPMFKAASSKPLV